ncbi:ribonuclease H1-like isoform X2 [Hyla sarda]|uniref:ribonuclease H1-like isoform X2 n=1 Tax=Hyla sarda TaxID=327740 RepID=UPI0024C211ED|nr:ribonuclease H1-like isoform X2 [Hyla sarda]
MFYAVRRGRQPGVYNSWDECKDQVNRYPYARYKKFPTYEQALHFLRGSDNSSKSSYKQAMTEWIPRGKENGCTTLYGEEVVNKEEFEKLDNLCKELDVKWAASRAVEQALDHSIASLNVCTDSQFTIKGMTEWIPRGKENGCTTLYGEEVVNKEEFEKLDNLCKELDVKLTHVPGHCGNPENEMADWLARKGTRK